MQRDYSPYGEVVTAAGNDETAYQFSGKEKDLATGFGYFGARYYFPGIGRWLVPDPADVGWSPYAYCLNSPVIMVDPDGRNPLLIPILIGAAMGAFQGYQVGQAQGADGLEMFGYVAGGAAIGGASGYLGGSIAAAGGVFANTASIGVSSFANSFGMNILSGGKTDISVSLGAFSYNFDQKEFGYLGKKGNSKLENFGYFMGSVANLADISKAVGGTNATLYTEKDDAISHSAIVDKNNNKLMSYGPDDNKVPSNYFEYATYVRKSTSDYDVYYDLPVDVTVSKYSVNLMRGIGKVLPYQGVSINCTNMASLTLWLNGIPNIGIHPYVLYATTWAYSNGFRPDLFSYQLHKNKY